MKIEIEKVPEGVRLTLTTGNNKPFVYIMKPSQVELLASMIRTAAASDKFRFEYQD